MSLCPPTTLGSRHPLPCPWQGDKGTLTSLCCWRCQPSPWPPLPFGEGAVGAHILSSLSLICVI